MSYWDLGVFSGAEPLYIVLNVSANSGTSPTMTPTLEMDDNTSFTSAVVVWTAPVQLTASNTAGMFIYKLPNTTRADRYARFSTGSIGGSNTPTFSFTVDLTPNAPTGRMA